MNLSWSRQLALMEGLLNVSVAWLMITILPYSFWRRRLGRIFDIQELPKDLNPPAPDQDSVILDVVWVHAAIKRRFSMIFTCLMLGFSARSMLRRRGYQSIIVLGVGRRDRDESSVLGAHAWVIHNSTDIVGGDDRGDFSAVAAYGDF